MEGRDERRAPEEAIGEAWHKRKDAPEGETKGRGQGHMKENKENETTQGGVR